MAVIAIANQKGGVGKTATVHALGAALAGEGMRIALIDSDPQASLTQACGITDAGGQSLAEVLGGSSPGRLAMSDILRNLAPGLNLAPADIALANVELGLTARTGRENVLKRALAGISARYDLILIDCPPSLSLLTVGALVAADAVIIPTQPQAADLRGLRLFQDTLQTIRAELNPGLEILGILVTFYDPRLNHHRAAIEALQGSGLPVLPVTVGRSVRVAEAAGAGQSIVDYEPGNPQAENYRQLGKAVQGWLNHPEKPKT